MKINETLVKAQKIVHYEQTNFMGRLHGGDMLEFLVDTGMISAMKVAKNTSVIASLDKVEFKKGVNLGDIIEIQAKVVYIGNTSMEVEMAAIKDEETIVTASAVYVNIDENFRPKPINEKIEAENSEEKEALANGLKRRNSRVRKSKDDKERNIDLTKGLRYRLEDTIYVGPSLTYDGKIISAGKLLKKMDDLGGSLMLKFIGYKGYTKYSDSVVTVAVSDMNFWSPIKLGDIIRINAGLVYVGRTSADTLINVMKIDLNKGIEEKVTEAYFSYVRIDNEGKPKEMPRYTPETDQEKKMWELSLARRNKISQMSSH
ncbi:acyl-CoA thioesterase [Acidianus sulfidivorans JP7]|uniref:Acyl-CoA thioesterase n=1 Tax=Acidianus sulfidivorans JP7 TaxID=619593 RepID=A0A2U9ILV3_9CREN|nr:hotdog domain-containing protein [Acidianus sulfidivorans]AWR97006.1 acyl-CoA thioesterase [Acidianus sulfidivorans JP7]